MNPDRVLGDFFVCVRGFLELLFLGGARKRGDRRPSAGDNLRDEVEIARTHLTLVFRRRVAAVLRRKLRTLVTAFTGLDEL